MLLIRMVRRVVGSMRRACPKRPTLLWAAILVLVIAAAAAWLNLSQAGEGTVTATNPGDQSGEQSLHRRQPFPVADAGDHFHAVTGAPATLDGSDSFDQTARLLTFRWRLRHAPRGSAAGLADPARPNPTFTPDIPGKYKFELVVTNGSHDSAPAYVKVTAFAPGSAPPTARPGRDRSGFVGTPVLLDGGASDDPEGASLIFLWSFRMVPPRSGLTDVDIVGRHTATPSFTPDVRGKYHVALQVSDGTHTDEATVEVDVRGHAEPNADAGPDQRVTGLAPVTLDGSGSNDPDGGPAPLQFDWWLVAVPPGSALTGSALQHAHTAVPSFTPDVVGQYVWRLRVSDGADADADNVLIEVTPRGNRPPVAGDDTAVTDQNASAGIAVLGNDSDPDGDPLTIAGVTQGTQGGAVAINGVTVTYTPPPNWSGTDSFTYAISDGRGGTATGTVTVTVTPVNHPPTVTLSADQTSGSLLLAVTFAATASDPDGDPLTYAWDFGDGVTKPSGSASESHTYQSAGSFIATVTVSDGTVTAQASLTITPGEIPPDPSTVAPPLSQTATTDLRSATAFLYSGLNPIQTGVAPGTITPVRAAVLRGTVLNSAGTPIAGVAISILNHAEFGQTRTRADGWFDLAVNGGGLLTVKYDNPGYLPVQRQVQTPWQDYVVLPDVVLVQPDSNATTIDLSAAIPFQVARGSVITDADGTRQATLLFPQGTTATMVLADGTTQSLGPLLHIRATEYTVGSTGRSAMPGDMPPTDAYAYATEFSVDEAVAAGATRVAFSQPVLSYNENFLGFPVGVLVPAMYHDQLKGQWIDFDNGRVIKILSITGGLADLDTTGSGTADNGVALGITTAERAQLAMLYVPGTSLWRVPIPHFTPVDL